MNYILWRGTKLFINPTFFNKGLQLKISWCSSLIFFLLMHTFASEHILLRYSDIIKIKSITLFLVLYFLPFNSFTKNTLSLECANTLQYIFALLVYGRHVHITHKDTLQRFIHVNFELSCITQNFQWIIQ
jgi:hypothetical protein